MRFLHGAPVHAGDDRLRPFLLPVLREHHAGTVQQLLPVRQATAQGKEAQVCFDF